MAYTPVPSKANGDPAYSASDINTYIKANQAAGVPDIFTTKGDIAVATAEDVASRFGVGANGAYLVAASGEATGVKWANNFALRLSAPSAVVGTDTNITWGTEDFDVFGKIAVPSAEYAPTISGYFLVSAYIQIPITDAPVVNDYVKLILRDSTDAVNDGYLAEVYAQATNVTTCAISGMGVFYLEALHGYAIRVTSNWIIANQTANAACRVSLVRLGSIGV